MTTLRKRKHAPPLERRRIITGHSARWHATEAWITKYIGLHGQPRPAAEGVVGQIFLAKREMTDRHTIYVKDLTGDGTHSKAQTGHFQYGQFRHVWQETAKVWKSPEGDLFDVVESEERVRGFKRCNRCEFVHEKIVKAKTKEEREFWREKQERHWTDVRNGRKVYGANIQRALANKDSVISISIDAADQRKMRIPVTSSNAKRIGALWKLKLKVTGVIIHGDGYYPFVSFPWLKTGANITATIMHALFSQGKFDGKETAYIQWDGANDNVAFTNVYYFVWLLLASQRKGATLKTIVISRFLVGHTHFDVDQLFSVFSQFIFGSRRLQRKRRDMFTLSEFKEMTERAHKNLKQFKWLHATYDWDQFFKNSKECGQLEKGLQKAFVIRMTVDDTQPGQVFVESKPMGDRTNRRTF